ncbi:hypothetical protein [Actinophytocola glycyrrhizae]|uniref:Uncharacterized protein n=1 Tax=Actinophytocola glycyrrhizae TaxID=2044873 RepID=A0ABV9RVI4_9PSEU
MRPTDTGPAHARRDGATVFRQPSWPGSEVLGNRPGWPTQFPPPPEVPVARTAADPPGWARSRHRGSGSRVPASRGSGRVRADDAPPSFLREPIVARDVPAQAAAPDPLADTVPVAPPSHGALDAGPLPGAVVHALPETPATGLRKFDLGTVPASVTPPRSWRKAAWFAVGTSAAVVLGLSVATSELMGRPVQDSTMIDALPALPTGPLTLAPLPNEDPRSDPPESTPPTTARTTPGTRTTTSPTQGSSPARDTVVGSTTGVESVAPTGPSSEGPAAAGSPATPNRPVRRTVGPAPVTPTDPAAMGDRTEAYFRLVTSDPVAAHAMTTGGMASEGAKGIEARYGGVRRVEVQDITIDRNQGITTSRVKVVHEDGTETVEQRQLTFTWGGDPKITDDSVTQ